MVVFSTRQVGKMLGVRPDYLTRAIWLDKIRTPQKSPSGDFLWTVGDIERAGWQLLHRQVTIPAESKATDAK